MNDRTNGAPDGAAHDNGPADTGTGAHPPRRGRTRAEERIAALGDAPGGLVQEVERLHAELEEAQRATEEARAAWQRSAADFANYRRRSEQERAEQAGLASESLLLRVLALADDFDLAIEHVPEDALGSPWVEGISAIDRKLRQLLESAGVTAIETVGQPFDPHEQQAISYEETTEAPDGTVLRELTRGYRLRDRILRPALVAVARNDTGAPR
jgi:molecular chaperone GrpE